MKMATTTTNPFAGLQETITENEPLGPNTWYRIGGPAKWMIRPRNLDELKLAAQRCAENDIPNYVLGLGANVLVSDQGVNGAVFRLEEEHWRTVRYEGNLVHVGAGVDMQKLIVRTVREGLAGIENLAGIPGTIGGGIRMNAGGKFGELGSFIQTVTVMDDEGTVFTRTKDDLVFAYRKSNISARFILGATLKQEQDDPEKVVKRTKEIWMYKQNSQPLNTKNCGCVFKNPGGGTGAGALIDQAGLKGMRVGGAEVSTKHANFIVAHPGCRADDVKRLINIIKEKIWDKNGLTLETEVQVW
jgi:UDP-N-acetylmuramate dehydrogenase